MTLAAQIGFTVGIFVILGFATGLFHIIAIGWAMKQERKSREDKDE